MEENGTFTFVFLTLSSYIGRGSYDIRNARSVLDTDDGNYRYNFHRTDQKLEFIAEESSENTWYVDIPDGAFFSES